MGYWETYNKRLTVNGNTSRERRVNHLKDTIIRKSVDNPSYKDVLLNGEETKLIINTGTKPYFKEFESLPNQKVLAGDYIEWANSTWLVLNADCDDEIYTDGNLRQCQHRIYWQKADGTIVSRFAYTENASAYNNGETGNNTITLESNQFMVYMPYDDETADLDNGVRVHMSRSNRRCKPYDLTRPDDVTYGFGEKGVLNIIFTQTQYNQDKDKLITLEDGTQAWICDYVEMDDIDTPTTPPENPDEMTDLRVVISGNKNLKVGFSRTYTATITDIDGNEVTDVDFDWYVDSDFAIEQFVDGNKIELLVEDEDLVGETFTLSVTAIKNSVVETSVEITVVEAF